MPKGDLFENHVSTHVRKKTFESHQKDQKQENLNSEIGSYSFGNLIGQFREHLKVVLAVGVNAIEGNFEIGDDFFTPKSLACFCSCGPSSPFPIIIKLTFWGKLTRLEITSSLAFFRTNLLVVTKKTSHVKKYKDNFAITPSAYIFSIQSSCLGLARGK